MVGNGRDYSDAIIRRRYTNTTGEQEYQTADGRWWEIWDGIIRTGQEVKFFNTDEL